MNIKIPRNFSKTYNIKNLETGEIDRQAKAYVKNGVLIIEAGIKFRNVMLDITKALYENDMRCAYCNNIIPREKVTIDHKIPQSLGGPTIPENLCIACQKCNNEKGALIDEEYEEWKSIKNVQKRVTYRKKAYEQHNLIRKTINKGMYVPKEWLQKNFETNKIITGLFFEKNRKKLNLQEKVHYNRIKEQLNRYGTFAEPIIIDQNNRLLDGAYMYCIAMEQNIEKVPVIKLENVQYQSSDHTEETVCLKEKRNKNTKKNKLRKNYKKKHSNMKKSAYNRKR